MLLAQHTRLVGMLDGHVFELEDIFVGEKLEQLDFAKGRYRKLSC